MPRDKPAPDSPTLDSAQERKRRLQQLSYKLAAERTSWSRWMPRLKRAFRSITKIDRRITRLERQIAELTRR